MAQLLPHRPQLLESFRKSALERQRPAHHSSPAGHSKGFVVLVGGAGGVLVTILWHVAVTAATTKSNRTAIKCRRRFGNLSETALPCSRMMFLSYNGARVPRSVHDGGKDLSASEPPGWRTLSCLTRTWGALGCPARRRWGCSGKRFGIVSDKPYSRQLLVVLLTMTS
jgi:hypothetical protein